MNFVFWIHRTNQSFHCHFAICLAGYIAQRGHKVSIYTCGVNKQYCPTKTLVTITDEEWYKDYEHSVKDLDQLATMVKDCIDSEKQNNFNYYDIGKKIDDLKSGEYIFII